MIILVADDNALCRELIRGLLEGTGQPAEKFGFQQIVWYPTTFTDLHAQRPPTFEINHNATLYSYIHVATECASMELQLREQTPTPRAVPVGLERPAP